MKDDWAQHDLRFHPQRGHFFPWVLGAPSGTSLEITFSKFGHSA
jgi:hypothetical protein